MASRDLQKLTLPDLPYDYAALEPVICGEIMQIHHQKHHQAYITNYNNALTQLDSAIANADTNTVVKLHNTIKFNGGVREGETTGQGGGESPLGSLAVAIDKHFGSLDALIQKMNAEGAGLQGSGWVWLGVDKELKRLVVETTANQFAVGFTVD